MKIYLASDHAGVELKTELYTQLLKSDFIPGIKIEAHDLGPHSLDSVDYPDFADLVAKKVHGFSIINSNNVSTPSPLTEVGILICGSGQGMSIRANKYPHIRAALCWNTEIAKLSREHNDANVLCLGSRVVNTDNALEILKIFLITHFAGGRHLQRVVKVGSPV